ncbi:MAG: phosphotransferase [Candidatus Moranbacteria bacterium]|nr:phosphotransferase [Candidatus Moranbacteria bacterium]
MNKKINSIKKVFKEEIKNFKINETGEDNLVIEINNEWIFRFPRDKNSGVFYFEKKFLPLFSKKSPVPIPDLKYITDDFIGYKKIKGSLLNKNLFQSLNSKEKNEIAKKFGHFLSALHSFPIVKAKKLGISVSWNNWRKKAYNRFKKKVAPKLSKQVCDNALNFLDDFFKMKYKPVVAHGDFYPADHIYYDKKLRNINGIIDFSDMTIEDAAMDFTSIYEDFGEIFFQNVFKHYGRKVEKDFFDRIKIRIKAFPLFDAPYAIEYNQPDKLKQRINQIEKEFKKLP